MSDRNMRAKAVRMRQQAMDEVKLEERRFFHRHGPLRNPMTVQDYCCDKCGRKASVGNGLGFDWLQRHGWKMLKARSKGLIVCPVCATKVKRRMMVVVNGRSYVGLGWVVAVGDEFVIIATKRRGWRVPAWQLKLGLVQNPHRFYQIRRDEIVGEA